MENHTPPTQAELDAAKASYSSNTVSAALIRRLITEVERLRLELTMNQGVWQIDRDHEMRGAQSECACPSCNLHRHIARLTKEVEELRKDKERLAFIVNLIWETRWVSEESDYQDMVGLAAAIRSGNFDAIDSAMQQKERDEEDFNEDAGKV